MKNTQIDWIIHVIMNGVACDECGEVENPFLEGIADIHTHGLNKYGQTELQISIAMDPRIAGTILNGMGLKVASGERKYSDGDIVDDIANVPIRLKEMPDANGKSVLRLIFPDANGLFPEDINCNPTFLLQMHPISMLYASSELPY